MSSLNKKKVGVKRLFEKSKKKLENGLAKDLHNLAGRSSK